VRPAAVVTTSSSEAGSGDDDIPEYVGRIDDGIFE